MTGYYHESDGTSAYPNRDLPDYVGRRLNEHQGGQMEVKRGFVDRTTWDHEVGEVSGFKVYKSESALRSAVTCADECGIVEIEMRVVRIALEGDM